MVFINKKRYEELLLAEKNVAFYQRAAEESRKIAEEKDAFAKEAIELSANENKAYFLFGSRYKGSQLNSIDPSLRYALDNFFGIFSSIEKAEKEMSRLIDGGNETFLTFSWKYVPSWATIAIIKGDRFYAVKRLCIVTSAGMPTRYHWEFVEEQSWLPKPESA